MVRTYVRKTSRHTWSEIAMQEAVQKVQSKALTLREAAEQYAVPYTSLQRRVSSPTGPIQVMGAKTVMDLESEKRFADRLLDLAKRGFEVTPKTVRKYAFEYCERMGIAHNFNQETKMAGQDWFHRFLKRNCDLSIGEPEGLSRARNNGMQLEEVVDFYEGLEEVLNRFNLKEKPECIYSQGETGLPLNNHLLNIVGENGSREVMTSVERGEDVTVIACMNATGSYIPPFVLFKGLYTRDDLMIGMPPGTQVMTMEEGWVTEEAFIEWVQHFNKHRTPGKVVVILDCHHSHMSLASADLCENLDIELVLRPHDTQALQPLDVCVFKHLKNFYNQCATSWQQSHPNVAFSQVDFGGIFKSAWSLAASVGNAVKGFETTGLYPLVSVSDQLLQNSNAPTASTSATGDEFLKEILPSPEKMHAKTTLKSRKSQEKSRSPKNRLPIKKGKLTPSLPIKGVKDSGTTESSVGRSAEASKNWHCIYCSELFGHPLKENWIQCFKCEGWCHENCSDKKMFNCLFICSGCKPDRDAS